MQSVGFIGGGRITRILVGGWARARALPDSVRVHDLNPLAVEALHAMAPAVEDAPAEAAALADVVFVALHPPAVIQAVWEIRPYLTREAILVSLAPKIPIAALEAASGTSRIVRMIPNAPSLIGRGYNPVTYGTGVDADEQISLAALFSPWGQTPEVPESHLEAYAVLTGMGPTYFWFQWQALREIAASFGLPAADADAALHAMVEGAVATLVKSGLPPSAVIDLVPVKPLAEIEAGVTAAYRMALPALHSKIKPTEIVAV